MNNITPFSARLRAAFPIILAAAGVFVLAIDVTAVDLEFKRIGVIAWSRFSTPPSPVALPESHFVIRDRLTLALGGGFVFRMTPHLSLDVAGQYIRKGTKADNRFLGTVAGTSFSDLRVLSAPVCLRYGPRHGSTPYVLAGFEVSYVISHEMKYFPAGSETGTVQKLGSSTRKFDFAALLGVGGEVVIKKFSFFAEVRWSAGLVNLSRSIADYPVVKTRVLSLQAGFRTSRKPFPF